MISHINHPLITHKAASI